MTHAIADAILVLHFAIAAFIVLGLPAFWLGAVCRWPWVRNRRLRLLHLAAIVFVAAQALAGVVCPLTVWEDALRGVAGQPGFVQRWVGAILYHDVPPWVFTTAYVAYATATAATWKWVPPARRADARTTGRGA